MVQNPEGRVIGEVGTTGKKDGIYIADDQINPNSIQDPFIESNFEKTFDLVT